MNNYETQTMTSLATGTNERRICSRCIMDESVPDIRYDENGECNYCKLHDILDAQFPIGDDGQKALNKLAKKLNAAAGSATKVVLVG